MSPPDSDERDLAKRRAVALHWDGHGAPRVTAKGRGYIAEEIIALAREHGIPMRDDAALVQILGQIDLDEEIPGALYAAIAEVLAFAYQLSGRDRVLASKRDGESR